MNCDNNQWWPVNHSRALEHYTRELQLAHATRDAQAAEQRARLAVAEAKRQRERADRLMKKCEALMAALRRRVA